MSDKSSMLAKDFIAPLYMNKLQGRVMTVPPRRKNKREILVVYGHISNLEHIFPLAKSLSKFGRVTIPDMPGFGGMQALYRIGEEPSLDALADYMAAFVKLAYKRRRVTIVGLAYGFCVVTRMLQKYPELAKRVDATISIGGYVHYEEFQMTSLKRHAIIGGAKLLAVRPMAWFVRTFVMRPLFVRLATGMGSYEHDLSGRPKRPGSWYETHAASLWKANDMRTYMLTISEAYRLNLCNKQVGIPVYHMAYAEDAKRSQRIVEQHMRIIFSDCHVSLVAHDEIRTKLDQTEKPFLAKTISEMLAHRPMQA